MNLKHLEHVTERFKLGLACDLSERAALAMALSSTGRAGEEVGAAIGAALSAPGVRIDDGDMDRLVTLAREHPDATPEQVGSMLVQDVFLSRVAEVLAEMRETDKTARYGDAMTAASARFPKEYDLYQTATGQRRPRR